MAERVDGKNTRDGRYFEVTPGAHRLDVTLYEGATGDQNQVDCQGDVQYKAFKAREHYQLIESSTGPGKSVRRWWTHPARKSPIRPTSPACRGNTQPSATACLAYGIKTSARFCPGFHRFLARLIHGLPVIEADAVSALGGEKIGPGAMLIPCAREPFETA